MTRFVEKYGDAVIIAFISLFVLGGVYAFMHLVVTLGIVTAEIGSAFLDFHTKAAAWKNSRIDWMQKNWPMVGAMFQAAASLFAVVQRHLRHQR